MGDSFDAPPLPPQSPSRGIPWDERARLGFVPALVETVKQVLFDAPAFFKAMPVRGGLSGPLVFALIAGYFGVAVQAVYEAIFRSLTGQMFADFAGHGELERFIQLMGSGIGLVLMLVFAPVFLSIGLFVGAGITHLFLLLLGGASNGFEATFRVTCFAQATALFAVLPFCGTPAQAVYQLVLLIIGLAEAQQTGKGTAAAAVLLPGLLLCCCCAAAIMAAFGGIASLAGFAR
jgi:hypothetical protein